MNYYKYIWNINTLIMSENKTNNAFVSSNTYNKCYKTIFIYILKDCKFFTEISLMSECQYDSVPKRPTASQRRAYVLGSTSITETMTSGSKPKGKCIMYNREIDGNIILGPIVCSLSETTQVKKVRKVTLKKNTSLYCIFKCYICSNVCY